jgi:hypothetical protein
MKELCFPVNDLSECVLLAGVLESASGDHAGFATTLQLHYSLQLTIKTLNIAEIEEKRVFKMQGLERPSAVVEHNLHNYN